MKKENLQWKLRWHERYSNIFKSNWLLSDKLTRYTTIDWQRIVNFFSS